jgi:tetraacyldisaccharide 4'-kinase
MWYRPSLHPLLFLLLPFTFLFACLAAVRRFLYRLGIFKTYKFNFPVIIVGNITVGGTGKTPFVISLVKFLQDKGYKPGIVSRGVGGKKHIAPYRVEQDDAASVVGDEALLLARNTECPVFICVDRAAAVRKLLKQTDCNIVVSDDGLQHYRLGRNMEIVIVDSERGLGNQYLLPAGPLREPASRLLTVDMVVMNGGDESESCAMTLEPCEFISVLHSERRIKFDEFPRQKIYAVAGIGHPQRFFTLLQEAGFDVINKSFPDHHAYQPRDFNLAEDLPILMTEKDAVKCADFADERYWYLRVSGKMSAAVKQEIESKIGGTSL